MKKTLVALAVLVTVPALAHAQKPVTETASVEVTAKIDAIDRSTRMITLTDKDGSSETVYAGPEVKRFDELKVGDTVTFRYYESVAMVIRKAGDTTAPPPPASDTTLVRGTGARPGGTVSKQDTATVTIKAIDQKTPAITVLTEDGRTVDFKVDDPKKLAGLKAGDKVEVTYTQAVVVSVK
jgi:Cu/Ag efflux protein CusF